MKRLGAIFVVVTLATVLATTSASGQEAEPSSSFATASPIGPPTKPPLGLLDELSRLWATVLSTPDLVSTELQALSVPTPRAVLECDTKGRVHSVRNEWGYLGGFETPGAALQNVLDEGFVIPVGGYRELAGDDGTTLFGYRNRGRVKVAVRVTEIEPGLWIPEWLADCPLSEFGRGADMGPGVWLWANGRNRTLQERRGPAHCRQQSVRTLWWTMSSGKRRDERVYVRDPEGRFRDQWQARYLRFTTLPANARDTGYRRDGAAIWMAADRDSIYIVDGRNVQRWPRIPTSAIGCA